MSICTLLQNSLKHPENVNQLKLKLVLKLSCIVEIQIINFEYPINKSYCIVYIVTMQSAYNDAWMLEGTLQRTIVTPYNLTKFKIRTLKCLHKYHKQFKHIWKEKTVFKAWLSSRIIYTTWIQWLCLIVNIETSAFSLSFAQRSVLTSRKLW